MEIIRFVHDISNRLSFSASLLIFCASSCTAFSSTFSLFAFKTAVCWSWASLSLPYGIFGCNGLSRRWYPLH